MENTEKILEQNRELRKEIETLKTKIEEQEKIIRNKEGHIELLLEVEREYEREKKTKAYRFALLFRRIGHAILPKGSKRRFVARVVKKVITNPKSVAQMISKKRIKNFFAVLKREGIAGVNERVNE